MNSISLRSLINALITHRIILSISAIMLLALGIRLYGINWDQGHGFHPDERSLYMQADCMYRILTHHYTYHDCAIFGDFPNINPGLPTLGIFFDATRSPLNPHWFPLGSIFIYLIVFIRLLISPFADLSSLDMRYVGRALSSIADVGSIYLLFILGRRMFSQNVGLLAAFLMSIAVVHIQSSHFYRPETFIVLFVLMSYWFMLNVIEYRRWRDWSLLGLSVGITFATKVSVLPLLIPLFLTYFFSVFRQNDKSENLFDSVRYAMVAAIIAVATFTLLTPYAFIDIAEFIADNTWEAEIARTAGKMPYTIQYIGTIPFVYELKHSFFWALGLPLGIAAIGGVLYALVNTLKGNPSWKIELLILSWVLPNFILVGLFFEVKFLRYLFPIMPFIILLAARGMLAIFDNARALSTSEKTFPSKLPMLSLFKIHTPHLTIVGIALVLAASLLYCMSFLSIYSKPHPAIAASEWINQNVGPGTTVLTDNHWTEGVPNLHRYNERQIPIFEDDDIAKMQTLASNLSRAQYIIFYSNFTYGSINRVPDKFPLSSNYYRKLFSGELGYEFEKSFTSYPSLLGISWKNDIFSRANLPEPKQMHKSLQPGFVINLGYADDNVVNYDHPTVMIFKNTRLLSKEQLSSKLTWLDDSKLPIGLMLDPNELIVQQDGGTWSQIIDGTSWTNQVPLLAWLLLLEILWLVSLPLAFFVFRPLPDRGIMLAKLLGILGASYIAWILASLHWLEFSRASMLVGLICLASLSSLVMLKVGNQVLSFLRKQWKLLAIGEVIFLLAFLSFIWVRMANPDLWHFARGGEKPMDLAYINAILRSSYMPPFDPWFSGGYLNYYYWGHFIVANFIKFTGITTSVAYNLAIPTFFALTVIGAYSLVFNISEGIRRTTSCITSYNISSMKTPIIAGIFGGIFVAILGNLDGVFQAYESLWNNLRNNQGYLAFDFWGSSRMIPELTDLKPSFLTFWIEERLVHTSGGFCGYGLRLDNTCPDISPHITEFPFFSFLFADLHAHVMAIPFTLLALGLGLSFILGLQNESKMWMFITSTFLALALGSLWVINSWDYPVYILATAVFMILGIPILLRRPSFSSKTFVIVGFAVFILLLSMLAFYPFHLSYETFGTTLKASKWQTPLFNYLQIHGLFIFILLTFLLHHTRNRLLLNMSRIKTLIKASTTPIKVQFNQFEGKFTSETFITVLWTIVMIYMIISGYKTGAFITILLGLTTLAISEELRHYNKSSPYVLFIISLAGLSFAIGLGVEFIRVGDDIGRMNTLFKFYLSSWVLMGLSSTSALWYLYQVKFFQIRKWSSTGHANVVTKTTWMTILSILFISSLIYPIWGTKARIADRFDSNQVTLNGESFMTDVIHWENDTPMILQSDYDAIKWLRSNIKGSPTILEAQTDQYRWGSRISVYTGLPTVLGWPWHQEQQRGNYSYIIRERANDISLAFSTPDPKQKLKIIDKYAIKYIIVGQLEKILYPSQGIDGFQFMLKQGFLKVSYSNQETTIYEVVNVPVSSQ